MKKIPKISIIVPVYNVENYLKNCIESILSQTFKDFEIILVNDGSTDTSYDICKYYLNIDSRVKVINKVNEGVSSARNTGLDVAIGEYIGFVDSDDYIHPQMYEILYNYISNTQSDIAQCDYKKTYNTYDKESVNFIKLDEDTIGKSILQYSNIESLNQFYDKHGMKFTPAWNKLYRKELFKKHRYKVGKNHEDEFIMHELLYESKKVIYIPVELYFYLQS